MKKVIANCWFAVLLLKTTDFRFTDHNLRHQIFLPIWPNAVLQIFPNAVVSNVEWNEWPYLSSTLHIKTSFQNDVTLFAHEAGNCYHCKRECTSRTSWLTLSKTVILTMRFLGWIILPWNGTVDDHLPCHTNFNC